MSLKEKHYAQEKLILMWSKVYSFISKWVRSKASCCTRLGVTNNEFTSNGTFHFPSL